MSPDNGFAEQLRAVLGLTVSTAAIAAPPRQQHLLEMIVRTAVHVIHASVGSLLLIDESAEELVFEVATSENLELLKNVRVPLGEGIAGLVALTGQPIAVSDAATDPRHAREIATLTGYQPRSLLCVPLEVEDRVIGVIELMDKVGANDFDTADIEALTLFASQAAVAIEQLRAYRNVAGLLSGMLASLAHAGGSEQDLEHRVEELARELEADDAFRRSVELATLVHTIAQQGADESQACLAILRGFSEYLRTRQRQITLGPAR
jgi:GAF domain-containing protein